MFTNGTDGSESSRLAGRALRDGVHEAVGTSKPWMAPCIGVVPWGEVREHVSLAKLPNGMVHRYSEGDSASHFRLGPLLELEPLHTHFLMIDVRCARSNRARARNAWAASDNGGRVGCAGDARAA